MVATGSSRIQAQAMADAVEEALDLITIDVSFISLKLVLPVATRLLSPDGNLICLIKPQFEAGREQVGKKGIVKDPAVQAEVIQKVIGYGMENGLYARGLTASPIAGAKGNREYLLWLARAGDAGARFDANFIHGIAGEIYV